MADSVENQGFFLFPPPVIHTLEHILTKNVSPKSTPMKSQKNYHQEAAEEAYQAMSLVVFWRGVVITFRNGKSCYERAILNTGYYCALVSNLRHYPVDALAPLTTEITKMVDDLKQSSDPVPLLPESILLKTYQSLLDVLYDQGQ